MDLELNTPGLQVGEWNSTTSNFIVNKIGTDLDPKNCEHVWLVTFYVLWFCCKIFFFLIRLPYPTKVHQIKGNAECMYFCPNIAILLGEVLVLGFCLGALQSIGIGYCYGFFKILVLGIVEALLGHFMNIGISIGYWYWVLLWLFQNIGIGYCQGLTGSLYEYWYQYWVLVLGEKVVLLRSASVHSTNIFLHIIFIYFCK